MAQNIVINFLCISPIPTLLLLYIDYITFLYYITLDYYIINISPLYYIITISTQNIVIL